MHSSSSAEKPKLLTLAWPIFVEQALRMLIAIVDTFMVSHISDDAVAGVSVSSQIVICFIIIFNFIGIGSSVVITHHLGANDRAGADKIAATAIGTNLWLGLAASIIVCLFSAPLLRVMQLPEALMPYAQPFLAIMGGTLFMEAINMSISAVLRAHKHTKDAMYVTLAQNVVNITGVCIVIFGLFGCPKMGVVGVAAVGVISRIVASLALWFLLRYPTHLRLRAHDIVEFSRERLGRILRIGLPGAGENLSYWLAFMLVTTFIARLGGESLAIQSYTLQIQRLVMLFSISLGLGTEILIGYLIGAGQFEEAYHELLKSLKIGFAVSTGLILIVALVAPWLLGWFTSDAAILAGGVWLLPLSILLGPGRVFNVVVINSLRAAGDVYFPIQMAFLSMWCVWVPLAWFLGLYLGWGLTGMWLAMIIDEWLRGVLMYRRWTKRQWVQHAERARAHVVAGPEIEPSI